MRPAILSSTFLLALILTAGLVFFIRASTRDRTEVRQLVTQAPSWESLKAALQEHFSQRGYSMTAFDQQTDQVTFAGFVAPSLALAFFLSGLAGVGLLCLALIASTLFVQLTPGLLALVSLAPLAGIFYWRGAGRQEKVQLGIKALVDPSASYLITITGHRDELAVLEEQFPLELRQHYG